MDELLSTEETGALLGLHRSSVVRLVDLGIIEARVYRYGSRPTIRIPRSAVEAFLARYSDPPAERPDPERRRG